MEVAEIVLIAAICSVGAFVQSISGFGYALLAIPLISIITGTTQAIVLVTVASAANTAVLAWINRHGVHWPVAARVIVSSVVGMPLGLWVLDVTDDRSLQIATGVTILLVAALMQRGVHVSRPSPTADVVAGALSGVLTMSTGTTGPPLVIGLHGRALSPAAFRGTLGIVFFTVGAISFVMFAVDGKVESASVSAALFAIPAQSAATFAGDRVAQRVSAERFGRLVLVLLAASAVAAIVAAL